MTPWRRGCAVLLGVIAACVRVPSAGVLLVRPDDPRLRYVGGFDERVPNAPRCAWPGAQIVVRFSGTSLVAQLEDTPADDAARETDWIDVLVDDREPATFVLAEGLHAYPLARGLPPGAHRATIWKRTEASVGVITLRGLQLDAGAALLPPGPAPARRIFFVGDSITAGFGNHAASEHCTGLAAHENNYESYGARAARELGAQYVARAWSGKGLLRNYDEVDRVALPALLDRAIPTEERSPARRERDAQVVVVNLGTNDFVRGVPPRAAFVAAYLRLVERLRAAHPRALILLALGPMVTDTYPQHGALGALRAWSASVAQARADAGDARVELIELASKRHEGLGCDAHPSLATHARLGEELAKRIRERLHW